MIAQDVVSEPVFHAFRLCRCVAGTRKIVCSRNFETASIDHEDLLCDRHEHVCAGSESCGVWWVRCIRTADIVYRSICACQPAGCRWEQGNPFLRSLPSPPLSLVCVRVLSGRVLSQSGPAALKTSESGARVCHVRYERLEKQHCGTRLTACSTAWSFIQVRWRHYWQLRKISALPTYLSLSDIIQLLFLYNHKGFEVAPISVARNVPGSQKRHTSAWRSTQLDGQALVCLISDMNQ